MVERNEVDVFIKNKVLELSCPTRKKEIEVNGGTLLSDLLLDSLDMVELTMDVEFEYGVQVPDDFTERQDVRFADITLDEVCDSMYKYIEPS